MSTPWHRDLWAQAVMHSKLTTTQKLVAVVMSQHVQGAGRTCWVSLPRLMEMASCGETAARKARNDLVSSGWLVVAEKHGQHKSTVYELVIQAVDNPARPSPAEGLSDSRPTPREVQTHTWRGSDPHLARFRPSPGDPHHSSDHTSEHSSSSNRVTARSIVAAALGCGDDDERLDFIPTYCNTHKARNPIAYLTRCVKQDGLQGFLGEYAKRAEATTSLGAPMPADEWIGGAGRRSWDEQKTREARLAKNPVGIPPAHLPPNEANEWQRRERDEIMAGRHEQAAS